MNILPKLLAWWETSSSFLLPPCFLHLWKSRRHTMKSSRKLFEHFVQDTYLFAEFIISISTNDWFRNQGPLFWNSEVTSWGIVHEGAIGTSDCYEGASWQQDVQDPWPWYCKYDFWFMQVRNVDCCISKYDRIEWTCNRDITIVQNVSGPGGDPWSWESSFWDLGCFLTWGRRGWAYSQAAMLANTTRPEYQEQRPTSVPEGDTDCLRTRTALQSVGMMKIGLSRPTNPRCLRRYSKLSTTSNPKSELSKNMPRATTATHLFTPV